MRSRKEIEEHNAEAALDGLSGWNTAIQLEVLLDIRELLLEASPQKQEGKDA